MASFLLGKKNIYFRWNIEKPINTNTIIVGADAGQTTCLTISDGTMTSSTQKCIHGHDLKSINNKMARKKKSGNAYQRALDHQINLFLP